MMFALFAVSGCMSSLKPDIQASVTDATTKINNRIDKNNADLMAKVDETAQLLLKDREKTRATMGELESKLSDLETAQSSQESACNNVKTAKKKARQAVDDFINNFCEEIEKLKLPAPGKPEKGKPTKLTADVCENLLRDSMKRKDED